MSTRRDIIDGGMACTARSGLIYTCKAGWIDLGHARADGVRQELWTPISNETGARSKDGKGFWVRYAQRMSKSILTAGASREYYLELGLTQSQRESVAWSIFKEVSFGFEALQSSFRFGWLTDSGFSCEDLVSNLLGFYRAVRPHVDYITLLKPVSRTAALKVWDNHGAVGARKNEEFSPRVFPCDECGDTIRGPARLQLPCELQMIAPATKGECFRDWDHFRDWDLRRR